MKVKRMGGGLAASGILNEGCCMERLDREEEKKKEGKKSCEATVEDKTPPLGKGLSITSMN